MPITKAAEHPEPYECESLTYGFSAEPSSSDTPSTVTLNRSRYVQHARNMGWPVWREPYGHGAFVVVRERESRLHGKGRQVLLRKF